MIKYITIMIVFFFSYHKWLLEDIFLSSDCLNNYLDKNIHSRHISILLQIMSFLFEVVELSILTLESTSLKKIQWIVLTFNLFSYIYICIQIQREMK